MVRIMDAGNPDGSRCSKREKPKLNKGAASVI